MDIETISLERSVAQLEQAVLEIGRQSRSADLDGRRSMRVIEETIETLLHKTLPEIHGRLDKLASRFDELEERMPMPEGIFEDNL